MDKTELEKRVDILEEFAIKQSELNQTLTGLLKTLSEEIKKL